MKDDFSKTFLGNTMKAAEALARKRRETRAPRKQTAQASKNWTRRKRAKQKAAA